MNFKKELLTYLISGGITTGVNYALYGALLFLDLPYLAANSIAWIGAILTAYALNRKWVFHSGRPIMGELCSFAGLRLITLLLENVLLRLFIGELAIPALTAKLTVSVVTIMGNYVLCKFRVFQKEVTYHE